ncbi:MAG: cytochrome b [Steroidobacteraceae bacterium]
MQTRARYTPTAIFLHWLLVAALFAQIGFGWFLGSVPRGTPERAIYVNLHKSTGLIIGTLILLRLYWRLTHRPPPPPSSMPAWERITARWSHVLLYACMILMPLSGYTASNFSKYGVHFFNAIKLPPWGIEDKTIYAVFNTTHIVTSYVFVALIVVHVLAALRHVFARDSVFNRMWPQSIAATSRVRE